MLRDSCNLQCVTGSYLIQPQSLYFKKFATRRRIKHSALNTECFHLIECRYITEQEALICRQYVTEMECMLGLEFKCTAQEECNHYLEGKQLNISYHIIRVNCVKQC